MTLISGRSVSSRVVAIALKTSQFAPNRLLCFTSRVNVYQYANDGSAARIPFQLSNNYATATKKVSAKSKAKKVVAKKKAVTTKKRTLKSPKAKTKTKAKPKLKAKASARKVKKPVKARRKIVKKVLTPEQALRVQVRKLKTQVLKAPTLAPRTAFNLYIAEAIKGKDMTLPEASSKYSSLPPSELESYTRRAAENKAINKEAMNKWITGFTPDEIRIANNARKHINKILKRRVYTPIEDLRQPKRPLTPFMQYCTQRFHSGELAGVPVADAAKKIAKDYKQLSPAQLKTYEELYAEDRKRYISDYRKAFYRDAGCVTNKND